MCRSYPVRNFFSFGMGRRRFLKYTDYLLIERLFVCLSCCAHKRKMVLPDPIRTFAGSVIFRLNLPQN